MYCCPGLAGLALVGLSLSLAMWPMQAAAQDDWSGAWIGYACPQGTAANPARCASLYVRLYSRNAKLCGSHVFATAGAREMDEGGTPSVVAALDGKLAQGTVQSTRSAPAVTLGLTLQLNNGEMLWQRDPKPEGNYLLPRSLKLTRSKEGGMLSPMFEQRLASSCTAYLDVPPEKGGPSPPPR